MASPVHFAVVRASKSVLIQTETSQSLDITTVSAIYHWLKWVHYMCHLIYIYLIYNVIYSLYVISSNRYLCMYASVGISCWYVVSCQPPKLTIDIREDSMIFFLIGRPHHWHYLGVWTALCPAVHVVIQPVASSSIRFADKWGLTHGYIQSEFFSSRVMEYVSDFIHKWLQIGHL